MSYSGISFMIFPLWHRSFISRQPFFTAKGRAMETITGFVEHIVYRNEDNGYTVLNLMAEEEEITCVGTFHVISEGESIEAEGEYSVHPSYGPQFKVQNYQMKAPEDLVSIERYLGSGAIKGVGAALAARIVRRFKDETFRIIEEEPERLAEIKGISERKAMEISQQMEEKKELRQAMIFLQNYGISLTLAVKIYHTYGMEMYRIIQENPYKLADDMEGVGFKIADEIARRVGIHMDSDFRIRSGILYVLFQASAEGHTFLPQDILTHRTCELLGVDASAVEKHYMDMAIDRKLVLKQSEEQIQIYAASFYYMEVNTAVMLRELNVKYDVSETEVEYRIRKQLVYDKDEIGFPCHGECFHDNTGFCICIDAGTSGQLLRVIDGTHIQSCPGQL